MVSWKKLNFNFKLIKMEFSGPSFGHSDSVGSQPESVEPLSPATPQGTSNGTANGTTTPASGVRGKLKSCSASFCSKSARKVSQNFVCFCQQCHFVQSRGFQLDISENSRKIWINVLTGVNLTCHSNYVKFDNC